jgi:hypothetical protein
VSSKGSQLSDVRAQRRSRLLPTSASLHPEPQRGGGPQSGSPVLIAKTPRVAHTVMRLESAASTFLIANFRFGGQRGLQPPSPRVTEDLRFRRAVYALCRATNHRSLPETVYRVELLVSGRKQRSLTFLAGTLRVTVFSQRPCPSPHAGDMVHRIVAGLRDSQLSSNLGAAAIRAKYYLCFLFALC